MSCVPGILWYGADDIEQFDALLEGQENVRLGFSRRARRVEAERRLVAAVSDKVGSRSIVMVGLMGCGKSAIGRRLATRLSLPFVDADDEIEAAAGKSITDIFAEHGEAYFRDGERKVIARLLKGGPQVLATGGGAFMDEQTRESIRKSGVSIWLNADLPVLLRRVARRTHRPLLANGDPEKTMQRLMDERYPVYAKADVTIESCDVPHDVVVDTLLKRLRDAL